MTMSPGVITTANSAMTRMAYRRRFERNAYDRIPSRASRYITTGNSSANPKASRKVVMKPTYSDRPSRACTPGRENPSRKLIATGMSR